MSTLLPYDSSLGSISVTQAIHPPSIYVDQLYYSYDFDLSAGDQILSIADGVVTSVVNFVVDGSLMAGSNNTSIFPQYGPGGTGNQITIYYDQLDLYVTYAHLDQGSIPFLKGDSVSQGDVIGEIGLTGIAIPTSYDHLHITYGTGTTSWGGSTSNFYLGTTTIADGSIAQNGPPSSIPNGQSPSAVLIFDESGVPLIEGTNAPVSQNISTPVDRQRSFSEALADNTIANDLNDIAKFFLEANLAPNVSNVSFSGSGDAAYFVEDLVGGIGLSGFSGLDGGILLSTGGFPGPSNTSGSYTVANGTSGDSDLDQVLLDAGFSGAGATQDAISIEFTLDVVPNSEVTGVSFDIVFGSEEYPEFSSSSFADVAAIFVNGQNYALFNSDPTTPLSVLDANVFSGNFIDNDISPFPSVYPIEWDGFSNVLTVRAPLQTGQNTIKIALADTGDQSLDSGLYIQDMDLLYGGGTSSGVLTVVNASISGGDLFLTGLIEEVNLFDGQDTVKGVAANFNGDIITGFAQGDQLVFLGSTFSQNDVTITSGSAILNIDTDQNGSVDTIVTLAGDYYGANFDISNVGADTVISVSFPAPNTPPSAQDDDFSVSEDQLLIGNVLSDNGNGLDSDPDGDPLTVSLVSGPLEGVLVLNADGSFSYEADADVFDLALPGSFIDQTFVYQIDDGNGGVDQATTTISVAIKDDGKTIEGTKRANELVGTDGGEDLIYGKNGNDIIFGLDGADQLIGGKGQDTLFGGESSDVLAGGRGNDDLHGEQGDDILEGGRGNDSLSGGLGNDILAGGRGNDVLRGGLDDDTLIGGRGNDIFVLALGDGTDTILDFSNGSDSIGLVGLSFEELDIEQSGDDTTISSNGELLAVLVDVEALTLETEDVFNFV
ncbi:choice-of-anchor L domain-containing protein [Ruegeria atlantica]|uniref:Peptidoglycan DD-metalloendopeptidase family protein n=1 Tax=Ruegeria atlantica TaxID=81569 RepID=A0ABX1W8G0_9RHOB|nr:choice-of-anchor L domain-containing protein [Ruegeria atlantica]NOD29567.1 peptidoglycan DD-metalloendopeptidase family protein [Ruegeria atlantica]